MDLTTEEMNFIYMFNRLSQDIHATAKDKGFWKEPNLGEKLALIHSEVSEALEEVRKVNRDVSTKIPGMKFTEELADIVIRVMDLAASKNLDLGKAIINKSNYNKTRPNKHGKLF